MGNDPAAEPAVWNGFTRPALDAAYNNTAAVANSADKLGEWTARSARLRAERALALDLAYGSRERNCIDLFACGQRNAPLFVFIHGGYWQRNAKEIFACMAEGPLSIGFDAALVGYTLAPQATLAGIVDEIAAAFAFLARVAPGYGMAQSGIVASGWSAGGHLAAMALELPQVDAALSISGVFDLEPIRHSYLNEALRLTPDDIAPLSPIHRIAATAKPIALVHGGAELPELRRQSQAYAASLAAAGRPRVTQELAGHDHFSILEEIATPGGAILPLLAGLRAG